MKYSNIPTFSIFSAVIVLATLASATKVGDDRSRQYPKFLRSHHDDFRVWQLHDKNSVHSRLARAIRHYIPEFENVTLPVFRRHQRLEENSSYRETDKAFQSTLTLAQAHKIHQLALEASHQVQRSHGHVIKPSTSLTSMAEISYRASNDDKSHILRFTPVGYGADPTGVQDSTEAFASLMQDFLAICPSRQMAANITNLGGATLDLQGGQYLISQPIVIPPMYGNAHIIDGTLQASASFPKDRWIIEIGNEDSCNPLKPDGHHDPQYSCNEFIDVTSVLLDANFVAAGGVRVSRVMGTTLTNVFITGFSEVGILISNGHEVMVTDAWLAECYWSTRHRCTENNSNSVGIRIEGMDHYITNTIVFDFARVGVEIWKAANILEGVHTWNGGSHGIVVGQNASHTTNNVRLLGCYLDYQTLDLWDPSNVVVESTFFYYGHVILRAGDQARINGLTLRFNHYNTGESVELDGTFEKLRSVSIEEEVDWAKTTKASQRLKLSNATEFSFDFTEQLLFPSIDRVSYSLASFSDKVVSHMARPPNGTKVKVVTAQPIDGIVYMTVEQGDNY